MKTAESALLRVRQAASRRSARVANALTALGTLLAVAFVLAAAGIGRRDARQRQLAQQALQAANAYNRSLLEASLDPLVTISPGRQDHRRQCGRPRRSPGLHGKS